MPNFKKFSEQSSVNLFKCEVKSSPVILKSALQPYMNKNFSFSEKLHTIEYHYRNIESLNCKILFFSDKEYCELASIKIGENELRIILDKPLWMRYEGEMAISIFCGVERIFSGAFSFLKDQAKISLFVGALQGKGADRDSKELISKLTTEWHGVRPRDMIVYVMCMLAKAIGAEQLVCVSDELHPSLIRDNPKSLSYDQIWIENNGIQNAMGYFILSTQMRMKAFSEITPKKRAMYRRRYEFLADLETRVKNGIWSDLPNIRSHCQQQGNQ